MNCLTKQNAIKHSMTSNISGKQKSKVSLHSIIHSNYQLNLSFPGKRIDTISIPAKRTTSCCFGGKNFDEMYITCSRYGVEGDELKETPLAGSVFRATGHGAKGTPAPIYEG